ncbi:MAG: stage II sporulation protein R [Eubacteriales bacterium]|nr:stage II sporulation protein R [Eubacteriales bacterium]
MNKFLSYIKRITSIRITSMHGIRLFLTTAVIVLMVGALVSVKLAAYSDSVSKDISDNLLRLHVIANSDSTADQELKLKVRDEILEYVQTILEDSSSIEETVEIVNNNIGSIIDISKAEVIANGKDYSIEADIGSYPFPTKTYGDVALPAGYYQALRVVIGAGEGSNWWCVLFPPLCFVDASKGKVPEPVKDDLRKVLTAEEYKLIVTTDEDKDLPVKVKFRVVEFFQETKIKFSGMLSRIFGSK